MESKTQLARDLGVSRSSLYYKRKKEVQDGALREQIVDVMSSNPAYGYRRVALALGINKKRTQRVMKKYGLKAYKRKARWRKRRDERRKEMPYPNLTKNRCPVVPGHTYVSDFTYLRHNSQFYYLATFMDRYTREIVGWNVSDRHTKDLVIGAFLDTFLNTGFQVPHIVHSDQGAEYCSQEYLNLVESLGIKVSMAKKASPWENGYQESFYGNFKTDLGLEFERYPTIGAFVEGIHHTINYYNSERIHSSLKTSPYGFRKQFQKLNLGLSKKWGSCYPDLCIQKEQMYNKYQWI